MAHPQRASKSSRPHQWSISASTNIYQNGNGQTQTSTNQKTHRCCCCCSSSSSLIFQGSSVITISDLEYNTTLWMISRWKQRDIQTTSSCAAICWPGLKVQIWEPYYDLIGFCFFSPSRQICTIPNKVLS